MIPLNSATSVTKIIKNKIAMLVPAILVYKTSSLPLPQRRTLIDTNSCFDDLSDFLNSLKVPFYLGKTPCLWKATATGQENVKTSKSNSKPTSSGQITNESLFSCWSKLTLELDSLEENVNSFSLRLVYITMLTPGKNSHFFVVA